MSRLASMPPFTASFCLGRTTMAKILQDTEFEEGADEIVGETIKGIDEEKGRLHPTLTMRFTRGAMAHLARYVEAVADLPGDQPLWMRQDVRLEGGDSWYRVEVKIERLTAAPDIHDNHYSFPSQKPFRQKSASRNVFGKYANRWKERSLWGWFRGRFRRWRRWFQRFWRRIFRRRRDFQRILKKTGVQLTAFEKSQ